MESTFRRVQFTPDLLPSDVTGSEIYGEQTASFDFQQRPIFGNLDLADEINRAPAKVQGAPRRPPEAAIFFGADREQLAQINQEPDSLETRKVETISYRPRRPALRHGALPS